MTLASSLSVAILSLAIVTSVGAGGPEVKVAVAAPAVDPDLPEALDPNTVSSLLTSSPFTRYLDLSERLTLTGVAYIQGKPVATLQDKVTKGTYLVTDTPNAQGWKLASATPSKQLKRAEVKIVVGGETVAIHYSDAQLAPETGKKRFTLDKGGETITTPDGQTFVRSSFYMSDEQREKYHNMPREQHDKWREIMRTNNDRLLGASSEEREAFVKKSFDQFQASQPK